MRPFLIITMVGVLGLGILGGLPSAGGIAPPMAWADDDGDYDHDQSPGPPPDGIEGPAPWGGPDQPGWRPRWLLGRDYEDHDQARAALQAGEIKPLRQVLEVVEQQFTGQMLEAELERKHDRWVYEIKMLAPDGSIMKLYYDAAALELVRAKGHGLKQWYCGDPDKRPKALDRWWGKGPDHDHGDDHHDDDKDHH